MQNSPNESFDIYLRALDKWMIYFGFEKLSVEKNWLFDVAYFKSQVEMSKFGTDKTYAFIKTYENVPVSKTFETFSEECYKYSLTIHKGAPLGMGTHLTVYPLALVNGITNELAEFIKSYCNKHFASVEFPGVLDLKTNYLYYYPVTPVWGALYYAGYRNNFYNYFSPLAWKKIGNQK